MATVQTQSRTAQVPLLLEDPELAEHLEEPRLSRACHDCRTRVIRLRGGPWSPEDAEVEGYSTLGLLVLDGLLARRVGLEGRFGAELLGNGDVLRPWQPEDAPPTLPHTGGWRVLAPSRLAVLDRAFALCAAPYPEVTAAVVGRAVRRSRHLAVNMAIVHQPRVDVRLHMLFWELADRWGRVHADGVHVHARLTHAMLGELVAARRPSVTKALKDLAERSVVRWTGKHWLLKGQPPGELREIRAGDAVPSAEA
jgi:CRP-like cAMP-binding protein